MVALPGDPRNGIPIDELAEEVRIDAAMGEAAPAAGWPTWICTRPSCRTRSSKASTSRQACTSISNSVRRRSNSTRRERGYIQIFEEAKGELIDPSCGACINAGPGASKTADTVTVSAQIETFPVVWSGQVYLASLLCRRCFGDCGKISSRMSF